MEPTKLTITNYLPIAEGCKGHSSSSPLNSVESTATNGSSRSRKRMAEWKVPAKSALLDLVEVHKRLERYESECENIRAYKGPASGADARQLHMRAQREGDAVTPEDDDDSDFCAEFTTPSRSSSASLMSGAYSIQPAVPLPEADFDSNGLGFFKDVGVDYLTLSGDSPVSNRRVAKIEESVNEGGLPWDC